jgi:DNA-binding XRE family transcriptional regulator
MVDFWPIARNGVIKSDKTNFSKQTRRHAQRGDDPGLRALGTLVRETRIGSELSQDALSLAAGVSRDTIIALEAGRPGVSLGKALRVLRVLGLDLNAGARS